VLTQFSPDEKHATLKDFIDIPEVYPAGRLDADSEGLVVLTDDGALQARISHPRHKMAKTYYAQVEGDAGDEALLRLCAGLDLGDFVTAPCVAEVVLPPSFLWSRTPPIRYRAAIPTSWLRITLREGKNRQVRRMTAKVGLPTLRLIRWSVGPWSLEGIPLGTWQQRVWSGDASQRY
jgi:23S rRNA pseudouridine2457 synthase